MVSPRETSSAERGYTRMRAVAARLLADERLDHTLAPTALVHEAWLRLANYRTEHELTPQEADALTCQVMRHVLVDHARRRARARRDAKLTVHGDQALEAACVWAPRFVLRVDEAIEDLGRMDPALADLVTMRFFGGYSLVEIAAATGVSLRTANRRWQLARAWLLDHLDTVPTPERPQ